MAEVRTRRPVSTPLVPIRLSASSRIVRGRAAEQDHLEAAAGVEVDVGGRHDPVQVEVLELGQPLGDPPGVVVVDQGDDAHRVARLERDGVLDQGRAHQAADRLAPVRVAVGLAVVDRTSGAARRRWRR